MGDPAPGFSVVVPTYNRRGLLERALESVFAQTLADFELIVIDDRSTDDTVEWLRANADPRLSVLINQGRKGASAARNVGVRAAKSEWIAFLDSDDWWYPRKLEEFRAALMRDPTIGLWYSGCRHVDDRGNPLRELRDGFTGDHRPRLRRLNPIHALPAVATRRDLLLAVGLFDESLPARQDMDLYFRLAGVTPFGFIDEVLTAVDMGPPDKISGSPRNRLNGWLGFYRKHAAALPLRDRLYHHKRIFFHALQARDPFLATMYAPGALCGKLIG